MPTPQENHEKSLNESTIFPIPTGIGACVFLLDDPTINPSDQVQNDNIVEAVHRSVVCY